MSAIAIDFGNSNTVVARWNVVTNRAESLKLPTISRAFPYDFLIPSLLYLQNAQTSQAAIGQQVINSGYAIESLRFFDQIKRYLSVSTGFMPVIDGIKVDPELLGQIFLDELFSQLRSQQISFSEVIFTAPVQAYERYLNWLEQCSKTFFAIDKQISIPKRIRIIDEPTAAALGYQIDQPSSLVLVIDFGGGTLDLALVRTPSHSNLNNWGSYVGEAEFHQPERQVEVIAKTGQFIGGEDITHWLVEDASHQYKLGKIGAGHILFTLMERVKINLSHNEVATEIYFASESQRCYEITYRRTQLENILKQRGFYQVLQTAINEVINRAASKGVLRIDIKHILMIGGSTLIPSVRETVVNLFSRAIVHDHKPFEAVAHGALMLNQGIRVKDYLFHSYAIRYWHRELQQWQYQTLFLRGQIYPTTKPTELILRASEANQASIELLIGELEKRSPGAAEVIFDGERLITKIETQAQEKFSPLSDTDIPQAIAQLNPLGQLGRDRLKVLFSISERRQLLVTVIDLETQSTLLSNQPVAELR